MEAEPGAANIKTEEENLENQDLSLFQATVSAVLSEYGWYLVILGVGVYLLIQHLSKNKPSQEQSSTSATSQDAVSVVRRQEALEASRRKMQAELDAKAAEFKDKQQRVEEEKRRQKIEMWESIQQGKSYKGNVKLAQDTDETASSSTVPKSKADKKSFRSSGYNPLSGEGGGTCSWRPGRRGPSAGG
ncbi:selenoprotein S [Brachyhypopomus gauderio]|uniref:selenoprotein S n=1 Tax=Brachyhypopomus gauderio TaxID=698409 RepID=UPI0040419EF4